MSTPHFRGPANHNSHFMSIDTGISTTHGAQSTNQQVLPRQLQSDWPAAPTISARRPATIRGQDSTASFSTAPYKAVIFAHDSLPWQCKAGLVWFSREIKQWHLYGVLHKSTPYIICV